MTTTTRKKPIYATTKQKYDVIRKLEEVCERIPTIDGVMRCKFNEAWTDARVAKEVIPEFQGSRGGANLVLNLRRDMFGDLVNEPKVRVSTKEALRAELDGYAARILELEGIVGRLLKDLGAEQAAAA